MCPHLELGNILFSPRHLIFLNSETSHTDLDDRGALHTFFNTVTSQLSLGILVNN